VQLGPHHQGVRALRRAPHADRRPPRPRGARVAGFVGAPALRLAAGVVQLRPPRHRLEGGPRRAVGAGEGRGAMRGRDRGAPRAGGAAGAASGPPRPCARDAARPLLLLRGRRRCVPHAAPAAHPRPPSPLPPAHANPAAPRRQIYKTPSSLHTASINGVAWAPQDLGLMFATASSDGSVGIVEHTGDGNWATTTVRREGEGTAGGSGAAAAGQQRDEASAGAAGAAERGAWTALCHCWR
jgi:hypothetical protein